MAGRNLTIDEWETNIGDLAEYQPTCPTLRPSKERRPSRRRGLATVPALPVEWYTHHTVNRQRLSATVEAEVLASVRARVGPRGLSDFVNRALRHELERAQLAELVAALHDELGPPTQDELTWASAVLAQPARRRRGAA